MNNNIADLNVGPVTSTKKSMDNSSQYENIWKSTNPMNEVLLHI